MLLKSLGFSSTACKKITGLVQGASESSFWINYGVTTISELYVAGKFAFADSSELFHKLQRHGSKTSRVSRMLEIPKFLARRFETSGSGTTKSSWCTAAYTMKRNRNGDYISAFTKEEHMKKNMWGLYMAEALRSTNIAVRQITMGVVDTYVFSSAFLGEIYLSRGPRRDYVSRWLSNASSGVARSLKQYYRWTVVRLLQHVVNMHPSKEKLTREIARYVENPNTEDIQSAIKHLLSKSSEDIGHLLDRIRFSPDVYVTIDDKAPEELQLTLHANDGGAPTPLLEWRRDIEYRSWTGDDEGVLRSEAIGEAIGGGARATNAALRRGVGSVRRGAAALGENIVEASKERDRRVWG